MHFIEDLRDGRVDKWIEVFTGQSYTHKKEVIFLAAMSTSPTISSVYLEILKKAIIQSPNFAIARHVLGNLLLTIGKEEEVREVIEEALGVVRKFKEISIDGTGNLGVFDNECTTVHCKTIVENVKRIKPLRLETTNLKVVCVANQMRPELQILS